MRVERLEAQPILRARHSTRNIIAHAFGVAMVRRTGAPTIGAIVAGRRQLDEIPIVLRLKGHRRERKLLRVGVVGGEVTPECSQWAVDLFTTNGGGQTIAFGHHRSTSHWLARHQQKAWDGGVKQYVVVADKT